MGRKINSFCFDWRTELLRHIVRKNSGLFYNFTSISMLRIKELRALSMILG